MADDLRARLEGHARAFEGIMSLIPAKYYYGEDNDDQWQRKKQTKEEKRAARKAKLDPANYKSALDVHKERELKRKRELEEEEGATLPGESTEKPGEGLKKSSKPAKKQKVQANDDAATSKSPKADLTPEEDAAVRQAKAEKRRMKRERKKDKKVKSEELKKSKKERQRLAKEEESNKSQSSGKSSGDITSSNKSSEKDGSIPLRQNGKASQKVKVTAAPKKSSGVNEDAEDEESEDEEYDDHNEILAETPESHIAQDIESSSRFDVSEEAGREDADSDSGSVSDSATSVSLADTPTFDTFHRQSSASSSSSIIPPTELTVTKSNPQVPSTSNKKIAEKLSINTDIADTIRLPHKPQPQSKLPNLAQVDPQVLKERLEARLSALRAARKADGPDGRPAKNRQELIEARRARDERRKNHKKELRAKAKKEHDAEAEAARLRGGSGSPMWSPAAMLSPRNLEQNSFSFGKVAFANGMEVIDTDTGNTVVDAEKKKKGPSDPKTALQAAQKKHSRLSGLDADKKTDIEEKDRWLNAKKRIQGERVRDDVSLLKKTLKRKDKMKSKSETEWNDRIEGVAKSKEAKQRKREENLKKRKEEKGGKKGKKTGSKTKGKFPAVANKPRARPGFEGSLRLGTRKT